MGYTFLSVRRAIRNSNRGLFHGVRRISHTFSPRWLCIVMWNRLPDCIFRHYRCCVNRNAGCVAVGDRWFSTFRAGDRRRDRRVYRPPSGIHVIRHAKITWRHNALDTDVFCHRRHPGVSRWRTGPCSWTSPRRKYRCLRIHRMGERCRVPTWWVWSRIARAQAVMPPEPVVPRRNRPTTDLGASNLNALELPILAGRGCEVAYSGAHCSQRSHDRPLQLCQLR